MSLKFFTRKDMSARTRTSEQMNLKGADAGPSRLIG